MTRALIFIFFFSPFAHADLWQDHLKPTLATGFDESGLLIIGGGLAAIALAQNSDYQMRDRFSGHKQMSESAAQVGNILGTGIPGAMIAIGQIYLDRENGWAHAEALIDTTIVTDVLKVVDRRARPSSDDHLSMPSGHTSTTFASATSLTYAYGWKAAVPAYALAVYTGVSRMSDDAHWFSDTVAGSVVGFFWGRATYAHHAPSAYHASAARATGSGTCGADSSARAADSAARDTDSSARDADSPTFHFVPVVSYEFTGGVALLRF